MKHLHNTVSNKQLKEAAAEDTTPRTTISFYKYFDIAQPQVFRDELYKEFVAIGVLGRVYIAAEGINAQISVPTANVEKLRELIYRADPALDGLRLNFAIEEAASSFWVLRMKVRNKIVADGIDDPTFSVSNTGTYLKAEQVNKMIADPEAIFVDMRNHYEYEVGHFEGALEVPSDTFKEQLPMALDMLASHKDKNIVMYCTGGIRCEKATAFMRHNGFANVYHVEGGIIEYARKAKEQGLDIKFKGKNFVFDERMGERITPDVLATCHQCHQPCDTHKNCANENCHQLFIQCANCATEFEGCCSPECVEISKLSPEARKELRKGEDNKSLIFRRPALAVS
jgi:UPF0176 protein